MWDLHETWLIKMILKNLLKKFSQEIVWPLESLSLPRTSLQCLTFSFTLMIHLCTNNLFGLVIIFHGIKFPSFWVLALFRSCVQSFCVATGKLETNAGFLLGMSRPVIIGPNHQLIYVRPKNFLSVGALVFIFSDPARLCWRRIAPA